MVGVKKLGNFIWSNKRYLFVFIFYLLVMTFFGFSRNTIDSIWNYGFSFAISNGQIPYRDFTMVIPPLYNFIMSIGLRFISTDNIIFLMEQALIVTISFMILYKLYGRRSWAFIATMCFPFFYGFCPTYNYFIFFLFLIVYYLESNKKNDYLIGFVLGCMLLTKYAVGIFFLIPSVIFYFRDKSKLFKRFIGCLIPCLIFLVYLLVTNSLYQFLDLCLFGLFDFAGDNTVLFNLLFILSIVMFLINIYLIIKDRKNLLYWYVLVSFSIMLPIFGKYHFFIYTLFFVLLFISREDKIKDKYIEYGSLLICIISIILNFFMTGVFLKLERYSGVNNFNYYYSIEETKDYFLEIDKIYDKYKTKGNMIFLSGNTSFLKIVNEDEMGYFTVFNRGNFGYNGTSKMINKIKDMKDTYFIVCENDYLYSKNGVIFSGEKSQFASEIVDYIILNSEKVEESFGYIVYYYEGE